MRPAPRQPRIVRSMLRATRCAKSQRKLGNLQLRAVGVLGKMRHGVAIELAACKIHARVGLGGIGGQHALEDDQRLQQFLPRRFRQLAQAADQNRSSAAAGPGSASTFSPRAANSSSTTSFSAGGSSESSRMLSGSDRLEGVHVGGEGRGRNSDSRPRAGNPAAMASTRGIDALCRASRTCGTRRKRRRPTAATVALRRAHQATLSCSHCRSSEAARSRSAERRLRRASTASSAACSAAKRSAK